MRLTRVSTLSVLPAISFLYESGATGPHHDPVASVVLGIAVILGLAKVGGDLAIRLGQPSVLGELVIAILAGNAGLVGFHGFEAIKANSAIDLFARIGVLILLFEVGLESTIGEMMKVGVSAFVVACIGVCAPFALGWAVGAWLLPADSVYVHAFLGATLCATSVGITGRVLKDLNASQTREARIILGAAVIDDVLGLLILVVVSGVISGASGGTPFTVSDAALPLSKAAGFLIGSLVLGYWLSPALFSFASRLKAPGVLLALGLSFCFILAWAADAIQLAPIVGAFAAGLILEDVHYRGFKDRGQRSLPELIAPIADFLVPIFFVLMGMRTDLAAFMRPEILALAAALTAAAVIGKQACGFGALGKRVDRLTVGLGMIPRGEVGLIFANIGMALSVGGAPIINQQTYSAVVVMVVLTTMITPPTLRWSAEKCPGSVAILQHPLTNLPHYKIKTTLELGI